MPRRSIPSLLLLAALAPATAVALPVGEVVEAPAVPEAEQAASVLGTTGLGVTLDAGEAAVSPPDGSVLGSEGNAPALGSGPPLAPDSGPALSPGASSPAATTLPPVGAGPSGSE